MIHKAHAFLKDSNYEDKCIFLCMEVINLITENVIRIGKQVSC